MLCTNMSQAGNWICRLPIWVGFSIGKLYLMGFQILLLYSCIFHSSRFFSFDRSSSIIKNAVRIKKEKKNEETSKQN